MQLFPVFFFSNVLLFCPFFPSLFQSCLDRTNVAQFSAGVEAMEQQLVVMGVRCSPKLDPSSNIVRVLIDMYVDIGDHIALQYGGSEAHKKVTAERSELISIGKVRVLIIINRFNLIVSSQSLS
jgi:hypothetical protein